MHIIPIASPLIIVVLSTIIVISYADVLPSFLAKAASAGGKQSIIDNNNNNNNNNISRYWESQRRTKYYQNFRQNLTNAGRSSNQDAVVSIYSTKAATTSDLRNSNNNNYVDYSKVDIESVPRKSRIFKAGNFVIDNDNKRKKSSTDDNNNDKLDEISDNNIDQDGDNGQIRYQGRIRNSTLVDDDYHVRNNNHSITTTTTTTATISTTIPTKLADDNDIIDINNGNKFMVTDNSGNAIFDNNVSSTTTTSSTELLNGVLQCFKSGYALTCFNQKILHLFKFWRETFSKAATFKIGQQTPANSDNNNINNSKNNNNNNNNGLITNAVGKAVYQIFGNFFGSINDQLEDKARQSGLNDYLQDITTDITDSTKEERGHHKKKKVQKEIKKLILKIILGIFLFKLKIKMILSMIQSVLVSKLIFAATLYVLTLTFKIWYEIKQSKHQHDKHVVYYDNAHHEHSYDLPEHEYDESYAPIHHGTGGATADSGWGGAAGWGGLWGRSYPTKRSEILINGATTTNGGPRPPFNQAAPNMLFRKPTPPSPAIPIFPVNKGTTIPDFAQLDDEDFS